MPSIALIGPDGAGKTTLTRRLERSGLARFKYLYMGIDIPASNVALPTSRWIERFKAHSGASSGGSGAEATARPGEPRGWIRPARRAIRSTARLGNRLAEEWFRQLLSWYYQRRGFTVLCDRHFVFDFSREIAGPGAESLDRRLHRWCLLHLYPRPDLVIFLDAPGELLFARKGESSVAELERRRQAFLRAGAKVPNFVRVDATRPLEDVYAEVAQHVMRVSSPQAASPRAVPPTTRETA